MGSHAVVNRSLIVVKDMQMQCLLWPYDLRNIVWYPKLSLNHPYVKKVSGQMKFSASVKSSSYKREKLKNMVML